MVTSRVFKEKDRIEKEHKKVREEKNIKNRYTSYTKEMNIGKRIGWDRKRVEENKKTTTDFLEFKYKYI